MPAKVTMIFIDEQHREVDNNQLPYEYGFAFCDTDLFFYYFPKSRNQKGIIFPL
jgi:hypothetical protein